MTCRFIDTHCHFDFPSFSSGEKANLQRAAQAGVGKITVPAAKVENFARVLALVENCQPLYVALGLYPSTLEKRSDVSLEQLQWALERRPAKVVAMGGIDLDLFGDDPQFERQQWLLDEQLKLAERCDLPMILHSRHTHDKLTIHLKRYDLPHTDVIHGFPGNLQQAERFIQLGCKIGVGGTVTYLRANKTRDVIAKLPLASLLLKTDAPDMPPNGFQGQPSHPERAARASTILCELHREPTDETVQALLNNTYTLFNVP